MHIRNLAFMAIATLTLSLSSCKTSTEVTYFKDLYGLTSGEISSTVQKSTLIRPDDRLSIVVSALDPASVTVFNLPISASQSISDTKISSINSLQTYLVDESGTINFPILGRIKVEGLSVNDLSDLLNEKISAYAKDPIVTVAITNFKISVIGEVNMPGMHLSDREHLSVIDAISLAGDITVYGKRDNVMVIRKNNGKIEFTRLNLNSSECMNSDYFYLQQNDIVYVEPNNVKKKSSQYGTKTQINMSLASVIVSAVSAIASMAIALLIK